MNKIRSSLALAAGTIIVIGILLSLAAILGRPLFLFCNILKLFFTNIGIIFLFKINVLPLIKFITMYTINNKQLTFIDSRFYATETSFVPSVTTILEAYPKGAAYFEWLKTNGKDSDEIRDEAGRRGSIVHGLTESFDKGEEVNLVNEFGKIDYKLNEWSMFERYVDFRKRFEFDVKAIELNVISEELGFAGTIDRVIEMQGRRILLDIKTSNAIYPSYWLQLAAYEQLLRTMNVAVDQIAILWLNAKTRTEGKKDAIQGIGWQMVTKDEWSKDWELFQATKNLWTAENGTQKPKQLTYQISHKL